VPAAGKPVMLVTAEHVIAGNIDTRDLRISEILNDIDTSYVRIGDAGLFGKARNKQITTLRQCIVLKSMLELVLILDKQHETPQKRRHHFVEKKIVPVFLTVHGCEVRGGLPLERVGQTDPDPIWVLNQRTPQFFPVTQATVSRVVGAAGPLQVPTVIVNTAAVSLFSVGWETKPVEAPPPAAEK